jgi:hypothetical protein
MPDNSVQEIILSEIREMRGELKDIRENYTSRLVALETGIKPLLPNGRPGKIADLESEIQSLKNWRYWVVGACVGGTAVVSCVLRLFGHA